MTRGSVGTLSLYILYGIWRWAVLILDLLSIYFLDILPNLAACLK